MGDWKEEERAVRLGQGGVREDGWIGPSSLSPCLDSVNDNLHLAGRLYNCRILGWNASSHYVQNWLLFGSLWLGWLFGQAAQCSVAPPAANHNFISCI